MHPSLFYDLLVYPESSVCFYNSARESLHLVWLFKQQKIQNFDSTYGKPIPVVVNRLAIMAYLSSQASVDTGAAILEKIFRIFLRKNQNSLSSYWYTRAVPIVTTGKTAAYVNAKVFHSCLRFHNGCKSHCGVHANVN